MIQTNQAWTRSLRTSQDKGSFNGNAGVRFFNWSVAFTILCLLICLVKRYSRSNNDDSDELQQSDENSNNVIADGVDAKQNQENEEEQRKNVIFELFQSEHIQKVRIESTNPSLVETLLEAYKAKFSNHSIFDSSFFFVDDYSR